MVLTTRNICAVTIPPAAYDHQAAVVLVREKDNTATTEQTGRKEAAGSLGRCASFFLSVFFPVCFFRSMLLAKS